MKQSIKQSQQLNNFDQGQPAILFFHGTSPVQNLIQDDATVAEIAKKLASKGLAILSNKYKINSSYSSCTGQQQLAVYRAMQDA